MTASGGSRSLGVLAVAAAAMTGVNSVLLALGGFSPAAMLATLGSGAFGALLMVATAGWSWREAGADRTEPGPGGEPRGHRAVMIGAGQAQQVLSALSALSWAAQFTAHTEVVAASGLVGLSSVDIRHRCLI